ncbi:hypothetical protein IV203_012368 [Nitzschia inconspicua]|uniref:Uncharacterized protein n=1 Tax=Nitzschia inconspicua TaxID=303405 RepID=A0A9K3KUS9_9STRA|nr:hypothetical protein IV203_012368 [Nitzschia inconspicua]
MQTHARIQTLLLQYAQPIVWVEDAEDGFVDPEENLEPGEICLKSVRAFATNPADDPTNNINSNGDYHDNLRFLCAGALVQRPVDVDNTIPIICDAWMADAILNEGGPNLQLQGAIQVLDELFVSHLEGHIINRPPGFSRNSRTTEEDPDVAALRSFVLHCGDSVDNQWTCASFMAGQARGFAPLKDMVRTSSIYSSNFYDHNLDGFVFDSSKGMELYRSAATTSETANRIHRILPNKETLQRYTTKRFTIVDDNL